MTNTSPDHRCLLGLVQTQQLPPNTTLKQITNAYQPIIQQTIPYISEIWKIYCTISHNTITPTTQHITPNNTQTQSRLTIITGNNGTMSTQTIIEHQPTTYFRKGRRNNRQQPLPDPTQRTLPTHYLLTQTTTPSPRTTPEPTRNNTPYPNPHTLTPPKDELWRSPRRPSHPHLPLPTNTQPLTTDSQFFQVFMILCGEEFE